MFVKSAPGLTYFVHTDLRVGPKYEDVSIPTVRIFALNSLYKSKIKMLPALDITGTVEQMLHNLQHSFGNA